MEYGYSVSNKQICSFIFDEYLTILCSSSAVFQGAIIFLHNAKGENVPIREQGIYYLLRCSRIYNHDPYLRKTRIVKLLQQIVCNFTDLATDSACLTNHLCVNRRNEAGFPLLKPPPKKVGLLCYSGRPAESSSSYCTGTENFTTTATDIGPLTSGSPEDMFLSSLNFGLQNQQHQQLQQQQLQQQLEQQQSECQQLVQQHIECQQIEQQQQLKQHIEQQQRQQQEQQKEQQQQQEHQRQLEQQQRCRRNIENSIEANFNPYARIDLIDEYEPLQQEFDVASLSSKLPVWEVPSGVTWNEWETFLKSNISNDNEIYQSNNL